ncbi:MAG: hypothetical protein JXR50_03850 [Prolixibacteraceae bacterium]|nr:hypothetical protein [Prolixibacteraceae bacterium]
MKQIDNKALALLFAVVLISISSRSMGQIQFGVTVKGGMCKVIEENRNFTYDDGGYIIIPDDSYYDYGGFTSAKIFAIEGNIIERITSSRFSFEQAFGVEYKEIKEDYTQMYNNQTSKLNSGTSISFNIPVKCRYSLSGKIDTYIGLNNIFNLSTDYYIAHNPYNLRAVVGLDIMLYNRCLLGIEYGHDITSYGNFDNDKFRYKFNMLTLNFGFNLSKKAVR